MVSKPTYEDLVAQVRDASSQLKAAKQRLQNLQSIVSLSNAGIAELSNHILLSITRMTDSLYGFYGFLNEDESEMVLYAWTKETMKDCSVTNKPNRFPVENAGVWSEAIRKKKPYILNDYASCKTQRGLPAGHVEIRNLLVVPLVKNGHVLSISAVANSTNGYNREDATLLETFLFNVQALMDIKLAEESIRAEETKYRTVVDTVTEGIILQEASGNILTWNKGAEDVFGIPAEEALGRTSEDGCWPTIHEDGSHFAGRDHPSMTTLKTGKPCRNVIMGITQQDGGVKWIRINTNPIFSGNSENPVAVVISFCDITEAKEADETWHLAQSMAKVGSWSFTVETQQPSWSDQMFNVFGLDPSGEVPRYEAHKDFIHPDDWDRFDRAVQEAMQGTPYNIELRVIFPDGTTHWCNSQGFPRLNQDGKVVELYGITQDITERKNTEAARIKQHYYLEKAQELGKLGTWELDLVNNKLYWTEENCRIFGVPPGSVVDYETFLSKVHPDDLDYVDREWCSALGGKPYDIEHRLLLDGEVRWVREKAEVQFDPHGKAISAIGFTQDITLTKTHEQEKRQLEEKLYQAQRIEAVGTLAGGIAHDFNNMLSAISGNISYVMDKLDKSSETYEALVDALKSSEQAHLLTRQLLTFSRGGAPVKAVTDMNRLVSDASAFSIRGTNTKCEFELEDDLWAAVVDAGQIKQVINNLVINANQAMPDGGRILVRTENSRIFNRSPIPLEPGRYIKVVVEDQGIGISKRHLSKIFEPYFTTKQQGSGLGLATAFSVVQKHHGHIEVHSEVDRGTVFSIYLPATLKNAGDCAQDTASSHHGHGRILIMDDQEPIRVMAGRMLNTMGYDTAFAREGAQAIEMYREALKANNPFAAVILDLTVPGGMGGLKTVGELLKIDANVKAVVSSGYSNDPIMSEFADYGFCGVIPKPYTKSELAKAMSTLFGGGTPGET